MIELELMVLCVRQSHIIALFGFSAQYHISSLEIKFASLARFKCTLSFYSWRLNFQRYQDLTSFAISPYQQG